jgi:glycosyltransferase involved in cell wall biosynthesis
VLKDSETEALDQVGDRSATYPAKVIVVIPAFNSEETIGQVIDHIPRDLVSEVVVVDDGSRDATYDEALRKKAIVLRHAENLGYGGAQKTLYREALSRNADVVVLLHDDLQYAPELLPEITRPIMAGEADVVLGTRQQMLQGGMPLWRFIGNRLLTLLENLALNQDLSEYHTGYRAFSARALRSVDLSSLSNDFHFDSQILFSFVDKGARIAEVRIPTVYGEGSSSITPIKSLKYGFSIISTILKRLYHSPSVRRNRRVSFCESSPRS